MDQPSRYWQAFALGSAFFAGLTTILGKIGVAGISSNLATLVRTVVILFVSAGIISLRGEWQPIESIAPRTLLFLGLSGIATGLSWLCYYRALQIAPASSVAPLDKLSVVFAMVLAVLVLGEQPSLKTLIGGGCIVCGALILAWP